MVQLLRLNSRKKASLFGRGVFLYNYSMENRWKRALFYMLLFIAALYTSTHIMESARPLVDTLILIFVIVIFFVLEKVSIDYIYVFLLRKYGADIFLYEIFNKLYIDGEWISFFDWMYFTNNENIVIWFHEDMKQINLKIKRISESIFWLFFLICIILLIWKCNYYIIVILVLYLLFLSRRKHSVDTIKLKQYYKDLIHILRNNEADKEYMRNIKDKIIESINENDDIQILLYLLLGGIKKEYDAEVLAVVRNLDAKKEELGVDRHLFNSIYFVAYYMMLQNKSDLLPYCKVLIADNFDETIISDILDKQILPVHLKLHNLLLERYANNI